MKKLLLMMMVLFATLNVNAKCDWSTLKLQQWNERNYYKWYVSGQVLDDTCVDYMFMIYDFQTKKTDTLNSFRGLTEVQFNVKGKYKMYLKVWNRCEKCDTALYRPIEIIQFPGAGLGYSVDKSDCKKYKFEMTYIKGYPLKDTCMEYYMVFYKGPWIFRPLGLRHPQHACGEDSKCPRHFLPAFSKFHQHSTCAGPGLIVHQKPAL